MSDSVILEIIYLDFLSGRIPIPLEIGTHEDELGFATELVKLSKDIRLIFDNGSYLDFSVGTDINEMSSRAELANDSLQIEFKDIKIFDTSQTVRSKLNELVGAGFYEGFQEWWFITRVINRETFQYLRFNLEVEMSNGVFQSFPPGTTWNQCINSLERFIHLDADEVYDRSQKTEGSTEFCNRRCYSPQVPIIDPNNLPDDLMSDIKGIMELND